MKKILPFIAFAVLFGQAFAYDVFINSYRFAQESVIPIDLSSDTNLQGLWCFENNLNDSSGKGNNLTASGTISYSTDTLVQEGTYSSYQTSTNYASRTNANLSAAFPGKASTSTTAFTICGWFRAASYSSDAVIASIGNISTTPGFEVFTTASGKLSGKISTGTTAYAITGGTTLQTDTDYWFSLVWDGNNLNLWLGTSGTTVPSKDASPVACTGTMVAGGGGTPGFYLWADATFESTYGLDGYLDEIAIFNRGLTDNEVKSVKLYNVDGAK
jgi:hypothetical protein